MAIDLTALTKQRQMIDDIIRLASDPESAALLEKLIRPTLPTITDDMGHRTEQTRSPEILPSESISQIGAIRKVIASRTGTFTLADIGDDLRGTGMAIENIAVGRVLKRLASVYGEIRIAAKGAGSAPNHYEKA